MEQMTSKELSCCPILGSVSFFCMCYSWCVDLISTCVDLISTMSCVDFLATLCADSLMYIRMCTVPHYQQIPVPRFEPLMP